MKERISSTVSSVGTYYRDKYKGPFHSFEDTARIIIMLALATLLFWPDVTMYKIVRYILGIQVTLSLMSHLTRKMLFPYVQMSAFFAKAKEEPLSASIAILSIAMILSTLIFVSAHLFGGSPQ